MQKIDLRCLPVVSMKNVSQMSSDRHYGVIGHMERRKIIVLHTAIIIIIYIYHHSGVAGFSSLCGGPNNFTKIDCCIGEDGMGPRFFLHREHTFVYPKPQVYKCCSREAITSSKSDEITSTM